MNIKKGDIRALSAGIMLVLFILYFMDAHPTVTAFLGRTVARFQFFPSLFSAVSDSIKGGFIFAVLLLLPLMFGRVYCAVLCPLGIFQDILFFLARRYGKRRGRKRQKKGITGIEIEKKIGKEAKRVSPCRKAHPFLWYAILLLTSLFFFAGSHIPVNVLDPFSIFGRFCSSLLLPMCSVINNLLVSVTESFQFYVFTPLELRPVLWPLFWMSYAWLVLVIFMGFYHGRLYCNTLCPAGALFSLLSRVSLFRFSIDTALCTHCGKCERLCRSDCIDTIAGEVDSARCVSCFDCMDVCPENAVGYSRHPLLSTMKDSGGMGGDFLITRTRQKRGKRVPDDLAHGEKRKLLLKSLATGTGIMATLLPMRSILGRMSMVTDFPRALPVAPPGSLSVERFSNTCLACQACVSSCPEKVLLPGLISYGMAGIMQPRLDFTGSRCAYTCNACTLVCPSGAISPLSLGEKQRTRIGNVKFEKKKCLVYTHKRDCGACAEVCPTHAVYTVRENNIHHPRLKPDACIGCGACQLVCPVKPKAIYVVAARVHERAGPPFFQKGDKEGEERVMDSDDAFPF